MKFGSEGELMCTCAIPLLDTNDVCGNCGRKIDPDRLAKLKNLGKDSVEPFNKGGCKKCGAELTENQKFCGDCGSAVSANQSPKTKVFGSSISKSKSGTNFKNIAIIAAAGLGILFLLLVFGSAIQGGNQQDECFDREMTKFGAFADPKGWAVQSRLYCQSLYP